MFYTSFRIMSTLFQVFRLFAVCLWKLLSALFITLPVSVLNYAGKPSHAKTPAERIAKLYPTQTVRRSGYPEQRTAYTYAPATVIVTNSRVTVSR